ncbi:YesL family protein [Neobacillus drentensis]|uniref:YesL family protein n=1 Tax=Neobacillus drentensis TaxID=220684 RepID=UPI002FFDC549
MELNGVWGGLYKAMDWIMKFVYVQFLWTIFSVAGFLVLGLFPSTMAMFAVTRKWIMKDTDIPIFQTFWQIYKSEFFRTNIVGWINVGIGFVFYFYLRFFKELDGIMFDILFCLALALCVIYLMNLLFIAPVFVHYQLKIIEILKYSIMIALYNPFHAIAMAATAVGFFYLVSYIPGLIPFLSVSIVAFVFMWIAHLAFLRIEKKSA